MRNRFLLPFMLCSALSCVSAQETLADYQKKVEREEWDEIYTTKSKVPVRLPMDSKEAREIIAVFLPIFAKRTPEGAKLVGDITAFKNWAIFRGYTADAKGNQHTPKDGISSDTTVLFLKTNSGWTVVDYGLGHSDMFFIIWPAQYGAPVEILEAPKTKDGAATPDTNKDNSKKSIPQSEKAK